MITPQLAYNGRDIKAPAEVKQNLVHVLRVLAGRERDNRKVNMRTFQRVELVQKRGMHIPIGDILIAFEALEGAGVCRISKGSEGRMEKAEFKESARQAARKILGIAKALDQMAEPHERMLSAVKEILRAEGMSDSARLMVLRKLLDEE